MMSRKNTCTREDILKAQEVLKKEPFMLDDVENWSYKVRDVKIRPKKSNPKPLNYNSRNVELQREKQKIRCVETGEVYKNVKDVQKKTGLGCKIIWRACRDNLSSLIGGYHWEFVEEREDE